MQDNDGAWFDANEEPPTAGRVVWLYAKRAGVVRAYISEHDGMWYSPQNEKPGTQFVNPLAWKPIVPPSPPLPPIRKWVDANAE